MTVYYEMKEGEKLTPEQVSEIQAAAKRPITFDEECPEMTPDMFKKAYRPGKRRDGEMVTLKIQVTPATLNKAKTFGSNYISLMGELLDEAVNKYSAH